MSKPCRNTKGSNSSCARVRWYCVSSEEIWIWRTRRATALSSTYSPSLTASRILPAVSQPSSTSKAPALRLEEERSTPESFGAGWYKIELRLGRRIRQRRDEYPARSKPLPGAWEQANDCSRERDRRRPKTGEAAAHGQLRSILCFLGISLQHDESITIERGQHCRLTSSCRWHIVNSSCNDSTNRKSRPAWN